jgi:hypothetical protein
VGDAAGADALADEPGSGDPEPAPGWPAESDGDAAAVVAGQVAVAPIGLPEPGVTGAAW